MIVGEFWKSDRQYQDIIDSLGIRDAITIVNQYVPNEELASYLDLANVVVLPYRSATQSAVIQLAFGRDKSVITTDVGGLAEVVEDGRTGLVVPPEDPDALGKAVNRFFDEGLEPVFRANIEKTNQRFSWNSFEKALLELIGEQSV